MIHPRSRIAKRPKLLTASPILAALLFEFAPTFIMTAIRSLLAEQIPQAEQGRLSGCMAVVDGLACIAATLLFNFLFPATLHVFLPASYLVAAGLLLCPLLATGFAISRPALLLKAQLLLGFQIHPPSSAALERTQEELFGAEIGRFNCTSIAPR